LPRIDDYKESFRLAALDLKKKDPMSLAKAAGVEVSIGEMSSELIVPYLGGTYLVEIGAEVDVRRKEEGPEVSLPDMILIAHYLLGASGSKPRGRLITFRQVLDGSFYFEAFQKRARDPFLSFFGGNGKLFRKCAEIMGGTHIESGDFGMEFRVFPQIFVQLLLWEGDEEFPPDATVLFDESIQRHLSAEDIAVLSGALVYRLIGLGRKIQSGG